MMNWKGFGTKQSRANKDAILGFAYTDKTGPKETSVRITSVTAKIQTGQLLNNTRLQCYRYTSLLRLKF